MHTARRACKYNSRAAQRGGTASGSAVQAQANLAAGLACSTAESERPPTYQVTLLPCPCNCRQPWLLALPTSRRACQVRGSACEGRSHACRTQIHILRCPCCSSTHARPSRRIAFRPSATPQQLPHTPPVMGVCRLRFCTAAALWPQLRSCATSCSRINLALASAQPPATHSRIECLRATSRVSGASGHPSFRASGASGYPDSGQVHATPLRSMPARAWRLRQGLCLP